MPRKQKFLAGILALAIALSLMVFPASAGSNIFFLSLNDTLPAQSTQTTPIQYNGWVYVPVTVFSSRVTGINFGIYYGTTDNNESLVFYNLSGKTMTFDLVNGTVTTSTGETPAMGNVLQRNGTYYVPAYPLCRYFGLTYSYYTTEYGPLLRIKDSNAILSDSLFISSAASIMRGRVNAQGSTTSGGTTGGTTTTGGSGGGNTSTGGTTTTNPSSTTTITETTPQEEEEAAPVFSLYLGLKVGEKEISGALNALGTAGATAVVFFPADTLAQRADELRQAAGRGHKVGLIPVGDTEDARLESIRTGSALVEKILRQEVWFVLSSDTALSDAGYLCWSPDLTATGSTASGLYDTIVAFGQDRSRAGRVLLSGDTGSTVLSGALTSLSKDGDTFLRSRETAY